MTIIIMRIIAFFFTSKISSFGRRIRREGIGKDFIAKAFWSGLGAG